MRLIIIIIIISSRISIAIIIIIFFVFYLFFAHHSFLMSLSFRRRTIAAPPEEAVRQIVRLKQTAQDNICGVAVGLLAHLVASTAGDPVLFFQVASTLRFL